MANKFAGEIEQMQSGETLTTTSKTEKVKVPMMSAVEDTATVEELGIFFDENIEKQILHEVETTELPPNIKEIILADGVLGDRKLFTWKWMWYVCGDLLTLDCVDDEYRREARETKTLMALYTTLIDDIGEKLDDKTTFWELAKTAYPESEPDWDRMDIDSGYAKGVRRVWNELMDRLESAPRFEEFAEPFMFNMRQTIQSMEYTQMADHHAALMNREEMWYFDTQGIGSFLFWTIDLMFSPSFEKDDFREFRQIVYELQHMWRLGNWITTWELEVHEGDFSTGIFVEALDRNIVYESDLERVENGDLAPEMLIRQIKSSGIVEQFTADWVRRRDELYECDFGMNSLDSDNMVKMMERFMQTHLAIEKHR